MVSDKVVLHSSQIWKWWEWGSTMGLEGMIYNSERHNNLATKPEQVLLKQEIEKNLAMEFATFR